MAFKKGKTRSRTEKKPVNKSLTKALVAIIVAIVGWVGLTFVESYILTDKNVASVVIASVDIPQGTIVTEDNAGDYFKTETVNSDLVTAKTITDVKDIQGKFLTNVAAGEIMTSDRYYDTSDTRDLKNPTNLTFSAGSAEDTVNGTIRKGDIVDIYTSVTENDVTTYQLARENVYIQEAYDSSYVKIDSTDQATVASSFLVKLEEDDVANFKNAISKGSILMVKKDIDQNGETSSEIIGAQKDNTDAADQTEAVDTTEENTETDTSTETPAQNTENAAE